MKQAILGKMKHKDPDPVPNTWHIDLTFIVDPGSFFQIIPDPNISFQNHTNALQNNKNI